MDVEVDDDVMSFVLLCSNCTILLPAGCRAFFIFISTMQDNASEELREKRS